MCPAASAVPDSSGGIEYRENKRGDARARTLVMYARRAPDEFRQREAVYARSICADFEEADLHLARVARIFQ